MISEMGSAVHASAGARTGKDGSGVGDAAPRWTKAIDSAQDVLQHLLASNDEVQASLLRERLIREHADPVIRSVVYRKMGVSLDSVQRLERRALEAATSWRGSRSIPPKKVAELDAEEVYANCVTSLLTHLAALKSSPSPPPFLDFRSYVGQVALNAFAEVMRKAHPARHCLRRKLRSMLQGHSPESPFALWERRKPGEELCGRRQWEGQPCGSTSNYLLWQQDPRSFQQDALAGCDPRDFPVAELVDRVLDWIGGPMKLVHLVNGIAELLGVRQVERDVDQEAMDALLETADDTDVEEEAVQSVALECQIKSIWAEVQQLPLHQRHALLLHLDSDEARLFVQYGCCSPHELAEALDLPWDEFLGYFSQLPLPDQHIADRLGVTVRQVINFRKCARERLSRRLKWLQQP